MTTMKRKISDFKIFWHTLFDGYRGGMISHAEYQDLFGLGVRAMDDMAMEMKSQ